MSKLDWADIQAPSYGNYDSLALLSGREARLLLVLLANRAIYRGAWVVNGAAPSDAEWDEIEQAVNGLQGIFLTPNAGSIISGPNRSDFQT